MKERQERIGSKMGQIDKTGAEQNYQKFKTTKQETLRLQAAISGFFDYDTAYEHAEEKEAYVAYLKKRIRPALQSLLRDNRLDEIERFEEMGWFGAEILEELIVEAQTEGRLSAVIRLMRKKAEKYGYQDRDFSI